MINLLKDETGNKRRNTKNSFIHLVNHAHACLPRWLDVRPNLVSYKESRKWQNDENLCPIQTLKMYNQQFIARLLKHSANLARRNPASKLHWWSTDRLPRPKRPIVGPLGRTLDDRSWWVIIHSLWMRANKPGSISIRTYKDHLATWK
jgi:hypothetical protein